MENLKKSLINVFGETFDEGITLFKEMPMVRTRETSNPS